MGNALKKPIQLEEENPLEEYPVCVFALGAYAPREELDREFFQLGIHAHFVRTIEELQIIQSRPNVFASFIDLKAFPAAARIFQGRSVKQKSICVALMPELTIESSRMLAELGFFEVLTLPVNPLTFKSKAKALLGRFLISPGMPPGIKLSRNKSNLVSHGRTRAIWHIDESLSSWKTESLNPKTSPLVTGQYGDRIVPVKRLNFHREVSARLASSKELFRVIQGNDERESYIREMIRRKLKVFFWAKQQRWQHSCQVDQNRLDHRKLNFQYPKGMMRKQFQDSLVSAGVSKIFAKVDLNRAKVLFGQNLTELTLDERTFSINLPKQFFQVQQRKYFRLQLTKQNSFKMELRFSQMNCREFWLEEISAGGALLLMDSEWAAKLTKGQEISELNFEILGKTISCGARIQYIKKIENSESPGTFQVGIKFVGIDPVDRDGVNLFVMEEAYEYMKTFVGPDLD